VGGRRAEHSGSLGTVGSVDKHQRSRVTSPVGIDGVEGLYRSHFAPLMRVAYLMSDSVAAAEDAVHDVFVRCAPRLNEIEHPPSYLRAAVVNECRAQHRRSQRDHHVPPPEQLDELPHELLETRAALGRLSPRKRAAVVLRYFVDIPDAEIAKVLGCRPATVRTLLHRAINDLKEDLS